jgi:hypothetical protein
MYILVTLVEMAELAYFWVLYSFQLIYVSVFCANTLPFLLLLLLLLCFCRIIWSQVLWYLQNYFIHSGLLWLLGFFCASIWSFCIIWGVIGIFMGIVLNMLAAFHNMIVFTILILSIHKHERSFHLLVLSSISFFSVLLFSL